MPLTLLWLLTAVLALTNWVAVARHDHRLERWAKPATMVSLIAVALAWEATDTDQRVWLVIALVLCLLGDVLLLGDTERRFQAGLAAFLLGHLAYLACFAVVGLPGAWWSWGVVAVLAACVLATRRVVPAAHREGGPALAVPVAVYTLVIAAMAVLAWWTGQSLIALGATLFVASDSTLAVDKFVRPLPAGHLAVMVSYHLAQALLVVGILSAT